MIVKKRIRLLLVIGLIMLMIMGGSIFYFFIRETSILKSDIVQEASFSVYAPRKSPEGFKIREDDTKISGNVLTYSFLDDKSSTQISVTVQPKPPGFDMNQIIGNGTVSSTAVDVGAMYNLSAGGSSKHLIDSGDSLIFLTSSSMIDNSTINSLASNLQKIN